MGCTVDPAGCWRVTRQVALRIINKVPQTWGQAVQPFLEFCRWASQTPLRPSLPASLGTRGLKNRPKPPAFQGRQGASQINLGTSEATRGLQPDPNPNISKQKQADPAKTLHGPDRSTRSGMEASSQTPPSEENERPRARPKPKPCTRLVRTRPGKAQSTNRQVQKTKENSISPWLRNPKP